MYGNVPIKSKTKKQVAGIERVGTEWVLSAKDGAELGRFEWCLNPNVLIPLTKP